MEEIFWNQSTQGKQESDVVLVEKKDFFSVYLPASVTGWTRILVTPLSSEQVLTGVSLVTKNEQRFRFRQSRKKGFDQVLSLNAGLNALEISGLNLTSVRIELHRSSSFFATKRSI